MSASDKVSMQTEEVLRVELEFFRQEHRDLDQAIVALSNTATADRLMIQRLKKKKLQLKDKNIPYIFLHLVLFILFDFFKYNMRELKFYGVI